MTGPSIKTSLTYLAAFVWAAVKELGRWIRGKR